MMGASPLSNACSVLVQFAVGSVIALTMWVLNLHERPKLTGDLVRLWVLALGPLEPITCCRTRRAMLAGIVYTSGWAVCSTIMRTIARAVAFDVLRLVYRWLSLQVKSVAPLAVVHTLGNSLTNISLGRVAVSFTHTIKARFLMFSGFSHAMHIIMDFQLFAAPREAVLSRRGCIYIIMDRAWACQVVLCADG